MVVVFVTAGCASFKPTQTIADLLHEQEPGATRAQRGLAITAEDYSPAEKSAKAFDADLAAARIIPVLVQLTNQAAFDYSVRQKDISASMNGQELPQIPAIDAARQAAERDATAKAAAWTLAGGPLFWLTALTISGSHTSETNTKIDNHFRNFEIGDIIVKPGGTVGGFVFFGVPPKTSTGELTIRVAANQQEARDGNVLVLTLPPPAISIEHKLGSANR